MRKLIINADDFGISRGTTLGIIAAHENGVVSSTTAMMNMPYVKEALQLAARYPKLGVGIHLVLTTGVPVTGDCSSLVDEHGNLHSQKQGFDHCEVDLKELEKEWDAQIQKFIEMAGKLPTHIDSHHHVHLRRNLIDVALKLAKKYDIPMRQTTQDLTDYEPVVCFDKMYDDDVNLDYLKRHLDNDNPLQEVMCHPGYLDKYIYENSSYNISRIYELEFYQSPQLREYITQNFELVNYSAVAKK